MRNSMTVSHIEECDNGRVDDGQYKDHRARKLIDPNSSSLPSRGIDDKDMSSIVTSQYKGGYRTSNDAAGYIGDMRIIGKVEDSESLSQKGYSHACDPTLEETLDYGDYNQTYDKPGVEGINTDNTSSFEEKVIQEEFPKLCCPLWIVDAPL